jgi:Arc/MetJ-type ribon-helix-helix transcriptional regulator
MQSKGGRMSTATLDPIVSEFETTEQEAEHTAWIRAELARRRDDPRPPVPHDEIVRRMEERMARWPRHKGV